MFQVIIAAEKDVIFINFILVLQIRKWNRHLKDHNSEAWKKNSKNVGGAISPRLWGWWNERIGVWSWGEDYSNDSIAS
jgi:hypothetical protein